MLKRLLSLAIALMCFGGLYRAIAAEESVYRVEVDVTNQITTVFRASDDSIVRQMICSTGTGTRTPLGTFRLERPRPADRESWYYIGKYACYVKYPTRIRGSILFHSIPYAAKEMSTIDQEALAQLGEKASHGCIRLRWEDAKWIAENCPEGTVVVIYEGVTRREALRQQLLASGYDQTADQTYDQFLDASLASDAFSIGRGAEGDDVSLLQLRLTGLGFMEGSITGEYDEATTLAIMRYQSAAGLTVNGVVNGELTNRIMSEVDAVAEYATLIPGCSGTLVARFQRTLAALGFYEGDIDGAYGNALARATASFCGCMGIDASQGISPDTRKTAYQILDELTDRYDANGFLLKYTDVGFESKTRLDTVLYAEADAAGDRLTALSAGETVRVTGRVGRWRRVEYGGWTGYVPAGKLEAGTIASPVAHWGRKIPMLGEKDMVVGDMGDGVLALNRRLASLGFYNGEDLPLYSLATASAVEAYQRAAGLEVTGTATASLQRDIAFSDEITGTRVTLAAGSTGPAVAATQRLLSALQYYDGSCDGNYYDNTAQAVMRFTASNDLRKTAAATQTVQDALIRQYFDCEDRYGKGGYALSYSEDGQVQIVPAAVPEPDGTITDAEDIDEDIAAQILIEADPVLEEVDEPFAEVMLEEEEPRPAWLRPRPAGL